MNAVDNGQWGNDSFVTEGDDDDMSDDPDYESDDVNDERDRMSVNSTVTYGRMSAIN